MRSIPGLLGLSLLLCWLCTCIPAAHAFGLLAPAIVSRRQRHEQQSLYSSTSSSEEAKRLQESAFKLRQEADALREQLGTPSTFSREQLPKPPPVYTQIKDSSWVMTYRFCSDPVNDSDDDDDDKKKAQEETKKRHVYSGKLTVTFRSDGYTDLVSHVPSGSPSLEISKVWGWDEEVSQEDELEYVLFSVNAKLPESEETLRFYWQARIDTTPSGAMSLADGTVTVKRDVQPGFWGVFNGSGILAQFKHVGNFGGKAVE